MSEARQQHPVDLYRAGDHNFTELAELFAISRPTVYRTQALAGVDYRGVTVA